MRTSVNTDRDKKRHSRASRFRLEIWPLHTKDDYERMTAVLDKLVLVENPTPAQAARRDIMFTLMDAYETRHHPIDTSSVTPVDILKTLMQDRGMNASDLGRVLGNRSLGSLILNGKRELSKTHIKRLAGHFGVTPALFI